MIKQRAIQHQVYQQRYGSSVVRQMIALLKKTDADLVRRIEQRLGRIDAVGVDAGPATTARLQKLLDDVKLINKQAYQSLRSSLVAELRAFGLYESTFHAGLLSKLVGVDLEAPSTDLIARAVTSQPFQGRLLKEWVDGLALNRFNRLRDAIRMGIVEGQTVNDMVRSIRGTRANSFEDGVLAIDRRGAEAMVRTAVNFVGSEARDAVFEANKDIVDQWEWVSTLDSSTCLECAALDGQKFDLGDGPEQPAHVGCRCVKVPVLADEFAILNDIGTRASSEGQVRANLTYGEWLAKQPAAFQDEALGKTRGKLFRQGDLNIDKFTDQAGNTLTLDQLREREPTAFAEADA